MQNYIRILILFASLFVLNTLAQAAGYNTCKTSLNQDLAANVCSTVNIAQVMPHLHGDPDKNVKSVTLSNEKNSTFSKYDLYGIQETTVDTSFLFGASVFGKINGGAALFEEIKDNSPLLSEPTKSSTGVVVRKSWSKTSPVKISQEQADYLVTVQNALIERILQYEEINGKCDGLSLIPDTAFKMQFNTQEAANTYLSDSALQAKNLQYCSMQTPAETRTPIKGGVTTIDCGKGLADLYHVDNAYTFDPGKSTAALDKCIASVPKNGTILGVDIQSSASRLNNTGLITQKEFSETYCGVNSSDGGFLALSQRRAEEMKKYIQGKTSVSDEKFNLNYYGSNGDGSSGDVDPYENGRLKLEYMSKEQYMNAYGKSEDQVPANVGSKRAELDENKYVKVQIRYSTPDEILPEPKFEIKCTSYSLQCIGTTTPSNGKTKPPGTSTVPVHIDVGSGGCASCAAYY